MGEVVPATSPKEIDEIVAFREAVLERDGGPESLGRDVYDDDPGTLHCLVRGADGSCIGVGRLVAPCVCEEGREVIEGNPVIGPIVVAPSARGRGIARAILGFLEEEALAIYGRNGVVRVEGRVSGRLSGGADAFGYTIHKGEEKGGRATQTGVFRDLVVDAIDDAREGPPTA